MSIKSAPAPHVQDLNDDLPSAGLPYPPSYEEAERALPREGTSLVTQAIHVFGDPARARKWMTKPNDQLGNRAPLEMLRTEAGRHDVEELLGRIDEGMFA